MLEHTINLYYCKNITDILILGYTLNLSYYQNITNVLMLVITKLHDGKKEHYW